MVSTLWGLWVDRRGLKVRSGRLARRLRWVTGERIGPWQACYPEEKLPGEFLGHRSEGGQRRH